MFSKDTLKSIKKRDPRQLQTNQASKCNHRLKFSHKSNNNLPNRISRRATIDRMEEDEVEATEVQGSNKAM